MLATDRYLNHLLEMLDQGGNPAGPSARSENDLQAFFDMIAGDRIRIEPTDWQGYPVSGLLWNLPDLKIAGKSALAGHIRHRWQEFSASVAPQNPAPQTAVKNPRQSQQTGSPAVEESSVKEAVEIQPPAPLSPLPVLTSTATIRRDWFDRLTDWVAALVTLWK